MKNVEFKPNFYILYFYQVSYPLRSYQKKKEDKCAPPLWFRP